MMRKCPMCGAPVDNWKCSYCGYTIPPASQQVNPNAPTFQVPQNQFVTPPVMRPSTNPTIVYGVSRKNKTTALLLCIFLGFLGAHKFYAGRIGGGLLYLFTGGLFGIGWLIDIIVIASGHFKDVFGLAIQN